MMFPHLVSQANQHGGGVVVLFVLRLHFVCAIVDDLTLNYSLYQSAVVLSGAFIISPLAQNDIIDRVLILSLYHIHQHLFSQQFLQLILNVL